MSDILCDTMFPLYRKMFESGCDEYEHNPKYTVRKFYDGSKMTGFCVYNEENGYRNISELHYIGSDKFVCLKMWKFLKKGAKILKARVLKVNTKIINTMKKLGFTVEGETETMILFKREVVL